MTSPDSIIERVDTELARSLSEERSRWVSVSPLLSTVFDEIEGLVLGGGKRLRPQFTFWGWVGAGGSPDSVEPLRIGAAIELLHAFALFHDDVIDDASTRRNRVTTQYRAARQHSDEKWVGESRRFGEGSAILIGDITYVISDQLALSLSREARVLWNELRLEMNIGQYLDTVGSAQRERSKIATELVCRYKSAKYTIERPLHVGAVAADVACGTSLLPMFSAYGLPLGDAFQMRDDMLGAFGDTSSTGKPVGGDFIEGKPTPLLALACELANSDQRKVLDTVGSPGLTPSDIAQIQSVVHETGAAEQMEQRISQLADQAISSLDQSQLNGDAYSRLLDLATVVTTRNS